MAARTTASSAARYGIGCRASAWDHGYTIATFAMSRNIMLTKREIWQRGVSKPNELRVGSETEDTIRVGGFVVDRATQVALGDL
jgi:hypothetical protein